jgi:putative GTP pyrophosphokinase
MCLWKYKYASLEHRVNYKYKEQIPQHLYLELVECAGKIADLDNRMYLIHEIADMAYKHANQEEINALWQK